MQIAAGAVHVWTLDLDAPVDATALADDERERAAQLRSPVQRARFTSRRALMRTIFSRYLDRSAASLRYTAGPFGKPSLRDATITFSVASREECALLAIASGHDIGIDVERVRPLPDLDQLIDRFVAPVDRPSFAALDRSVRERRFLQRWTAIEATLKARGTGFHGVADASAFVESAPHTWPFEPSTSHVATLASYVPVDSVVQYRYNTRER